MKYGAKGMTSRSHLLEEVENFTFQPLDIFLNYLQWTRRLVAVEVAVKWDFVSDFGFRGINPSVRDVRENLAFEVILYALLELHSLGVAQVGIRLRQAFSVAADLGGLIPFTQRGKDCLEFGAAQGDAS